MKALPFLARLVLAAVLLGFISRSLDLSKIGLMVQDIALSWVILTCSLILMVRFVVALRWQLLLAAEGIESSLRTLSRVVFISMFFGYFLPGGIGTDVIRGYKLVKSGEQTRGVVASLVMDGLLGIAAIAFVALVGAILAELTGEVTNIFLPLLVLQSSIFAGLWFMVCLAKRWQAATSFRNMRFGNPWSQLLTAALSIINMQKLRGNCFAALSLSILIVFIRCTIFYCLYRAFAAEPPFVLFVLFIPLVFLIVMIPVSIAGLGVREVTLVHLFGSVGLSAEVSISSGLMFHFLQILTSLPGLFLWFIEERALHSRPPQDDTFVPIEKVSCQSSKMARLTLSKHK